MPDEWLTFEVPYYVWDMAEKFKDEVIDDFLSEYEAGRTPNPCLRCNESIKFAAVLERALALGFDAVCTGHYARIIDGPRGRELHRAVDPEKDQSYVLGVLNAHQLERALFPLGDTPKPEVRAEAAARGLLVADKPDSHDICFIPDGDTKAFLAQRLGERPGVVVDTAGAVVGEHEGAYAYTVGQRRGLGLEVAAADRAPRYVLSIEPVSNVITVGPESALAVDRIVGDRFVWCGAAGEPTFECSVQVRAHGVDVPAVATVDGQGLDLRLAEPQRGVAPGQAAVVYRQTQAIGSATITRAWSDDNATHGG